MVSSLPSSSANDEANSQISRINTKDGTPQNGTNVSRGIFGATVGLERLLKLFNKHDIKATFL
jgi:hypothetical protein